MAATLSHGRLKECITNQTRLLNIVFGLSWLSIDIYNLKWNLTTPKSKFFLEFDFLRKREKSVVNL